MENKVLYTITISFALIINCCIFAIPLTNEQNTDDLKSVVPLTEINIDESSENKTDNETSKNL